MKTMNATPNASTKSHYLRPAIACVLMVVVGLLLGQSARGDLVTNTYTSSGTWVCPAGVTSVQVEVWGGGGGGGSATRATGSAYGGGGGGGAYARLNSYAVTEGNSYIYIVGAGGAGGIGGSGTAANGGATYFINTSTLHANGGSGGGNADTTVNARPPGGAGGAVGVTGDAQYAGGNGGTQVTTTAYGGQGGGSGGISSAGNSGTNSQTTGGEVAAVLGGGPGGAPNATASANGPGQIPSVGPGGGGGGARMNTTGTQLGGAGRAGQIRFVYTGAAPAGTNTTTTVTTSGSPSAFGQSVTFTATIAPSIGSDVPTGTVQFKTNGVALGSPVTVTTGTSPNGTASISTSELPVAGSPHTITAEYVATGNFNSSSGTLSGGQTVAVVSQFEWNNPGSGDWNTATNWTPAGPPINAIARVDNGGTANVTANALYPIGNLRVGYGTGGTTGTLNIGANLTATAASEIGRSGNGTLNVTAGNLQLPGTTSITLRFGVLAAGTGMGTQSGGTVATAGTVSIGVQGNGGYSLTNGSLLASNNLTVGASAGGNGTLTQSGGTIVVGSNPGNGFAYVGQLGTGVFNLSGGTFKSATFSIGEGTGASGTVNQTGGTIDLLTGPAGAGSMLLGLSGTGVYSISNGTFSAASMTVTNGTVNVRPGSTLSLTGGLSLGAPATINFTFGASGVSGMAAGGAGEVDSSATINIDGTAYTGGAGNFTLIDAASFTDTPAITLANFALGATHVWDTNSGDFRVYVGNQAPVAQDFAAGVAVGGSVTLDVVGKYASDANGDSLAITAVAGAANGTVNIVGNTNLVYTSTNGAAGDSFTYTVSDGKGGADTKTVTVSTYNPEGFNRISGPTLVSPGLYQIDYLGVPGQEYALDESPDLVPPYTWYPVVTNSAGGTGAISYTVPLSYPSGSFRTRHVP
jgi:hypothetical protein